MGPPATSAETPAQIERNVDCSREEEAFSTGLAWGGFKKALFSSYLQWNCLQKEDLSLPRREEMNSLFHDYSTYRHGLTHGPNMHDLPKGG